MRILLAENEELIRDTFAMNIADMDHTLKVVADGAEAWEELMRGETDIIISDYKMPRMDGLELLQRVRSYAPTASIPFILMSGQDRSPSGRLLLDICREARANFFHKGASSIRVILDALESS